MTNKKLPKKPTIIKEKGSEVVFSMISGHKQNYDMVTDLPKEVFSDNEHKK